MKNAYEILGVPQNASKVNIVKGQVLAMKSGKFPSRDIAIAQKQLSTPSQRLAVDFTFPVFDEVAKGSIVTTKFQVVEIDLEKINPNEFDSLK